MTELNLLTITNIMFKDRHLWKEVSAEDKEQFFFIVNRLFSKMYPEISLKLNNKIIDKVSAMDTLFYFMATKPYPNFLWSKSQKKKEKEDGLHTYFGITKDELEHIKKYFPDEYSEEVDYINKLKKQKMI
jgi:hypothetical protein